MTTLAGKTPANTFKDLLQVSNNNSGIDGTLRPVEDGEGTQGPLLLSTTAARLAGPLDFSGTNHAGVRLNNLTTVQRDALNPARGMLIHNTTSDQMEEYNGTAWVQGGGGPVSYDDILDTPEFAEVAFTGDYDDLINKPNLAGQVNALDAATRASYNDALLIIQNGQARQVPLSALSPSAGIQVSWFGAPSGSDDMATIQAAYTFAINSSRKLVFDNPNGQATEWIMLGTARDIDAKLGTPHVKSVTSSTFETDRAHGLKTGDVIQFCGSDIGSGGGYTQVKAYKEHFVRVDTTTTFSLYDTRARAVAGGATGLYTPSSGITTTGSFNTLTTAANLNNGNTSVTVTDASKVIVGDRLNLTGSGASTYPKVTGVAGNVVSFTPAYSGSTISSGATVWLSSIDVASTLTYEAGTTISVLGAPGTFNNAGTSFIVTSIVGQTLHISIPPNSSLPTPGLSQTFLLGLWLDPKYLNLKFEICGMPGVIVKKHINATSSNELFQFFFGTSVYIHDLELWGRSYGNIQYPNIVNGDDGIRVFGCSGATIERCKFRYFGDSAIRTHSSSLWVGARSTTYPQAGVYSDDIVVQNCRFLDCFQISTTNSNSDYQGGSKNLRYLNNVFENMGSSVKFANRAPGSMNIILQGNILTNSGYNGFELDSCDNYLISGNTFDNFKAYAVQIIANDLQPVGFEFNDCKIVDNTIKAGPLNVSGGGGVRVVMDSYPDGTKWDYKGMEIRGNKIYDLPSGHTPILISDGSYVGLRIQDNLIYNCKAQYLINITPRINGTAGFINDWILSGNIFKKCTGQKSSPFYIRATGTAGGPYIRGISIHGNRWDGTELTLGSSGANDARFVLADYVEDMEISGNFTNAYSGNQFFVLTEAKNVTIRDNTMTNLNAANYGLINPENVDGLVIRDNRLRNSFNTSPIAINRTCKNVRIFGNDFTGSVNQTISVGNIPVKTSPDGRRREDYVASAPSAGTHEPGDRYWINTPAAGASPGGICVTGGSYSAISSTADSTTGSAVLSNVSAMTNVSVGAYVTHPGFTGTRRVISMTANTATLDANATSDSTGGALVHSAPAFKAMAALAA